jgi:PAS domain-containing protein
VRHYASSIEQVFTTGKPIEVERKTVVHDQEIWLVAYWSPLKDEKGNVTAVIGTSRDITGRKMAEQKIEESQASLSRSILELQAIIDALPGLVSVVDLDFNVMLANRAVIDTFGQSSPDEVIGKKCYKVRKGRRAVCTQCAVKQAIETGLSITRVSTPDEEAQMGFATKAYAVPLKDAEGNIWGGVEVIMDVSDLRQAENEVLKKMHDMERFNKLMIGRENRMITLKQEINTLSTQLGKRKKYRVPDEVK